MKTFEKLAAVLGIIGALAGTGYSYLEAQSGIKAAVAKTNTVSDKLAEIRKESKDIAERVGRVEGVVQGQDVTEIREELITIRRELKELYKAQAELLKKVDDRLDDFEDKNTNPLSVR